MLRSLIYMFSAQYTRELGMELIPLGIEPLETLTPEQARKWLEADKEVQVLLTESSDPAFLTACRDANPAIHIFLIAHASLKPADLRELLKLNIRSVIQYQESRSQLAEEIIREIVQQNIRTREKRLHVRVQPKSFEKLTASIYLRRRNHFLSTVIIDISAGGIAVRIPEGTNESVLENGMHVDPLILSIKGSEVRTIAVMVSRRNSLASFKFENVESKDMRIIAAYIHNRLSENAGMFMEQNSITTHGPGSAL